MAPSGALEPCRWRHRPDYGRLFGAIDPVVSALRLRPAPARHPAPRAPRAALRPATRASPRASRRLPPLASSLPPGLALVPRYGHQAVLRTRQSSLAPSLRLLRRYYVVILQNLIQILR